MDLPNQSLQYAKALTLERRHRLFEQQTEPGMRARD